MKKIFTFSTAFLFIIGATNHARSQDAGTTTAVKGGVVINFSKLAKKELLNPPPIQQRDFEEKDDDLTGVPTNRPVPADAKIFKLASGYITKINSSMIESVQTASPAPIQSFNGLLDNNAVIPPDIAGAAGPNHLFENLNSQYRVFDKTGGTVSTVSLSAFWSGLNSTGFSPYSDPHIVFDSASGRWLACIIGAKSNFGPYAIFLAVSLTNDPTGNWYEYSIATGTAAFLPDYPLLGYNKNWIVITTNDFKNSSFLRTRIVVYNKTKALAGTLTSAKTFFDSTLFTVAPAETLDPLLAKEFMLTDYNGNSGGNGYVRICSITGTASAPVYKRGVIVGVNQPWAEASNDAPQLGTTRKINTGGTKMRTVMVRNGCIWATHTVYLPATGVTRSATDFWQIRTSDNTVIQYGLIDDPTATLWTSYPSLAVTPDNSVLIGSTMVGSTIYASAVYSYRNGADAPNTFRDVYTYQSGLNTYYKTFGGTRNRWGDFSSTSLDPVNGTFWTLQEFATATANTWGTSWANVDHPVSPVAQAKTNNLSITDNTLTINPNPGKGYFTINYTAAKQGLAYINVYNLTGNIIYQGKAEVTAGLNRINLNITHAGSGNYKLVVQSGNEIKRVQFVISK